MPEKGKSVRKAESKTKLKVKKSLAKQTYDTPRLSSKSNRGRRPLQIEEYATRSNAKVAAWKIELAEMRKTRPQKECDLFYNKIRNLQSRLRRRIECAKMTLKQKVEIKRFNELC